MPMLRTARSFLAIWALSMTACGASVGEGDVGQSDDALKGGIPANDHGKGKAGAEAGSAAPDDVDAGIDQPGGGKGPKDKADKDKVKKDKVDKDKADKAEKEKANKGKADKDKADKAKPAKADKEDAQEEEAP